MENIQVALRVRPLSKNELQRGEDSIWTAYDDKTVTTSSLYCKEQAVSKKRNNDSTKPAYSFDCCFNPEQENTWVYEKMVKRVALSSLNGINGTIFMYGQTGSGKTYTMMGYNKIEDTDTDYSDSCLDADLSPMKEKQPKKTMNVNDINQSTGVLILGLKDIFKAIEKVDIGLYNSSKCV